MFDLTTQRQGGCVVHRHEFVRTCYRGGGRRATGVRAALWPRRGGGGAEEMRAFGIRFPRALRRPFLAGRVSFFKSAGRRRIDMPGAMFLSNLVYVLQLIITREHSAHLLLFVAFFIALHFIAACLSWVHFASCAMNSYKFSR